MAINAVLDGGRSKRVTRHCNATSRVGRSGPMNRDAGDVVRSTRLHQLLDSPYQRESVARPVQALRIPTVLRRRAGLIASTALIGTALVAIAALVLPPTYTGTAQLHVEPTEAEIAAGLLSAVVDTHITIITSDGRLRSVLASVAEPEPASQTNADETGSLSKIRGTLRGLGKYVTTSVKAALGLVANESGDRADEAENGGVSIGDVKAALLVRQERQSNVVSVSYRDVDPRRAALVANAIVVGHVEELENRRQKEAERRRAVFNERIEAAAARRTQAEKAARSFYSARGGSTATGSDGNGAAAIEQELAIVRAALQRLAAANPDGGDPRGSGGRTGSVALEPPVRGTDHEIGLLTAQADVLERQLDERRSVVGDLLGQQLERQEVEGRVNAITRLVEDLERRRDDVDARNGPFAANASVLTMATVPVRPSSLNPLFLIPPGLFAFTLLGVFAALTRERTDHSFRTARDVSQALGITCLGTVPRPQSNRSRRERALDTVALTALHALGHRHPVQVLLVAAAKKQKEALGLAADLADAAGATARRVLLLELVADREASPVNQPPAEAATISFDNGSPTLVITRDPESLVDRGTVDTNVRAVLRALADDRLNAILSTLSGNYDLVVIDAPPIGISVETRLVALQADGVVLALEWGRTRRETAMEALDALDETAFLGKGSLPSVMAVLTCAPPRAT